MTRQYNKKKGARIYALYKGDEFLEIGTKEFLAKLLGVKPETIKVYGTPSYLKRAKKKDDNRLITCHIGYEKDNLIRGLKEC